MNHPGDITIVYTSKQYQPYAHTFDESYKFVGPSIAPRKDVESFPLKFSKKEASPFLFRWERFLTNNQNYMKHVSKHFEI